MSFDVINARRRAKHLIKSQAYKLRFPPGTQVRHVTHGVGYVIGEWGPIEVTGMSEAAHSMNACPGVYDCRFGSAHHWYLHSCRAEFLERIL